MRSTTTFRLAMLGAIATVMLSLTTGVALAQAVHPPAVVAVSPGKFDIEIGNRPTVQSMRLFNLGDKEVEIQATVVNWDLNEENRVEVLAPTEQSLDQWIVINPLRFKIPPRSSQTVRFAVRLRVEPEDGEHRAMLYFEEILPEERNEGEVYVNFKVGVAVYGNAGEVRRESGLHSIEVVSDARVFAARFDLTSSGNAHVRLGGQYAVWPVNMFPGVSAVVPIANVGEPEVTLPPESWQLGDYRRSRCWLARAARFRW
ncbi:MAG: fimbria/pilus periplasmic chaperone [Acidobacteria bacterium]|nr:fimbria/pilus periplasmic chaperone [Acidobacteriota bacterium]